MRKEVINLVKREYLQPGITVVGVQVEQPMLTGTQFSVSLVDSSENLDYLEKETTIIGTVSPGSSSNYVTSDKNAFTASDITF